MTRFYCKGIKMWGGMAGVWDIFVNFAVSFGFCAVLLAEAGIFTN